MFTQVCPSLVKNIPVLAVAITPSAYGNTPNIFVVPPVGCVAFVVPNF